MASFLDVHLLLPIFSWLEESNISFLFSMESAFLYEYMYRSNEIAKAQLALIQTTNLVEYCMDVYKALINTEEAPEGYMFLDVFDIEMHVRMNAVNKRYEEIMNSNLINCVFSCTAETENQDFVKLDSKDLEDFNVLLLCLLHCRFLRRTSIVAILLPSS